MQSGPGSANDPESVARFLKALYFVTSALLGVFWFILEALAPDSEPHSFGPIDESYLGSVAPGAAAYFLYFRFVQISRLLAPSDTAMVS